MYSGAADVTVRVYVDAWGLKRLVSLAIRRWKAPINSLRDPPLNFYVTFALRAHPTHPEAFPTTQDRSLMPLLDAMTEAWGADAAEEDGYEVNSVNETPEEPDPEPDRPVADDPPTDSLVMLGIPDASSATVAPIPVPVSSHPDGEPTMDSLKLQIQQIQTLG